MGLEFVYFFSDNSSFDSLNVATRSSFPGHEDRFALFEVCNELWKIDLLNFEDFYALPVVILQKKELK